MRQRARNNGSSAWSQETVDQAAEDTGTYKLFKEDKVDPYVDEWDAAAYEVGAEGERGDGEPNAAVSL